MRRLFALVVIAVSFITFGMAQSLDRSIENLETVRNINGELSGAYLQALDSVILQANALNELNTAILFRKKHLETIRKMKGDSCIEVAEDLWRLGNAYNMIGDTISGKGYYIQASNMLEINSENIDNYVGYLVSMSEKCIQKQDNVNLAVYFGEIIELANIFSCLYGESSCQYFEMLIHISYIYNRIGDENLFKQHCRMIIDNCNEIDSCNYRSVYLAYDFMKRYYFVNNKYYQQYQLAEEQLRKLDVDSTSFINEKINVLWELFLLETNDIPLSLSFGQRLEDLLMVIHPIKDDLFHVPLYLQAVSRLAQGNTLIKRFSEAIKYYKLCCEILEFRGEKESKQYYNTLLNLMICANDARDSQLVLQISDENKLKPMIELYSDCPDEDAYVYSISMYNAYISINQYDTALYYCNEMDSVMTQIHENTCYENNIDSIRIGIAYNKAVVLYEMGLYKESYELFNNCLEQTKKLLSEDNLLYFDCLNNIAACQIALGYYAESAITSNKTLSFIKSHWGTENETYLYCLHNSIIYNNRMGNCHKMLELALEEQSVCNVIYGVNSQEYANALGSLGAAYSCMKELEKAIECYSKAFQILEAHNPKPSTIAPLLQNMSRDLFEMGDDESGMRYLEKAEIALDSLYGRQSHEFAQFEYSFAKLLMTRRDSDAYQHFKNVADVLFELGYMYDPLYLNSLVYYGCLGIKMNEEMPSNYYYDLIQAVTSYYQKNFALYTQNERNSLTGNPMIISDIILTERNKHYNDKCLYDYLLFSKSLLLATSINFNKAVSNAGKHELIDIYNDIQALQRVIDMQSFGLPTENQSLELLNEKKISMERSLIAEMKELGYSQNDSITYNDVIRSLKSKEIAVEFVDYYHLKDEKTYYVALLAKTTWDKPVYVQLCTEDELKACLGNPNVTYSTDDLYRLLWQPLLEHVGDSCTVYFSPSGMLHTIALESLHTPDGSCLSDKYNLVRLTSTRELCKEKQPKAYETGAIYGGLQYDVEQQRMVEVAALNNNASDESPAFVLRGNDRGNWNYLPGTLIEAEHIAGIMRQANIGCGVYEGDLGSEESFKALSGGNTDIIHLATHGYFIEGEKADMNDFMNSLSPLARQKTDSVIDPLLRSGLILSGGNRAWLGKEVPEGIEDGVLTALEISTMDLSGTDMVVMSACETGLGDITSDGVFGLQRAFKMAGVQTLVMSLWKVDDNATSLMMQTFYEQLLSGKTKREAFNLAQAAVRGKYPEPYYWAGFIMLD